MTPNPQTETKLAPDYFLKACQKEYAQTLRLSESAFSSGDISKAQDLLQNASDMLRSCALYKQVAERLNAKANLFPMADSSEER